MGGREFGQQLEVKEAEKRTEMDFKRRDNGKIKRLETGGGAAGRMERVIGGEIYGAKA